jgi:hypothetical protein
MKEYIARDEFLKRFNVLYNVLDNLERILYSDSLVELIDIPVADVIEREKIDKAIEEIIEKSFISDIYNDRTDDKIIKVDDVVEILKRNIESKEEEEEE